MKITAMMAMTMAAGIAVQAGPTEKNHLTVYVQNTANVPRDVLEKAELLAHCMFASIGVKIDWVKGEPPASGNALAIELATNTPSTEQPGAAAYAMPYEGVHIVVFWDRIQLGLSSTQMLAHVMVHEITHILEGVSRHSASGIMKAHWNHGDVDAMRIHPLTFAPEDVCLIQAGMNRRAAMDHPAPVARAAE